MKLLGEELNIAIGFVPVNIATASNPGDYVSLKNYRQCTVVFVGAAGGAAEPATITLMQATAVAGTNSKALSCITRVFQKQAADLQTVGTFSEVTQAAAATYALGSGANGDKQAIVCISVNAEDLDVENGYDCLAAYVADVGSTSQLACVLYILSGARYLPPLTAIAD